MDVCTCLGLIVPSNCQLVTARLPAALSLWRLCLEMVLFTSGFLFQTSKVFVESKANMGKTKHISSSRQRSVFFHVLLSSSVSDLLWKSHTRPTTALPSARPQRQRNEEKRAALCQLCSEAQHSNCSVQPSNVKHARIQHIFFTKCTLFWAGRNFNVCACVIPGALRIFWNKVAHFSGVSQICQHKCSLTE